MRVRQQTRAGVIRKRVDSSGLGDYPKEYVICMQSKHWEDDLTWRGVGNTEIQEALELLRPVNFVLRGTFCCGLSILTT